MSTPAASCWWCVGRDRRPDTLRPRPLPPDEGGAGGGPAHPPVRAPAQVGSNLLLLGAAGFSKRKMQKLILCDAGQTKLLTTLWKARVYIGANNESNKKSKFRIPSTFTLKVRRGKKSFFLHSFHPDFKNWNKKPGIQIWQKDAALGFNYQQHKLSKIFLQFTFRIVSGSKKFPVLPSVPDMFLGPWIRIRNYFLRIWIFLSTSKTNLIKTLISDV